MSQLAPSIPAPRRAAPPDRATHLDLTVVIPTRNERDNIAPLVERLGQVRADLSIEVLFVDDSDDDTPQRIEDVAETSDLRLHVIHRPPAERNGGLGGAVQAGLLRANSTYVCVMDADLQHPPELVAKLYDEARAVNADVVVASRYCENGSLGDFSALRVAVSRASSLTAKLLFPRRLQTVTDPMSGFFLIRRAAVAANALKPSGFKILLEILLSDPPHLTSEVPFRFGERHAGDSKASMREAMLYLRRLLALRLTLRWRPTGASPAADAPRVRTAVPIRAIPRAEPTS